MCLQLCRWLAAAHWVGPSCALLLRRAIQHKKDPEFHWICTFKKKRVSFVFYSRLYAWVSFHHDLGSVAEDALTSWWKLGRKLPWAVGLTLSSPVKQWEVWGRPLSSSPVSSSVTDLFSLLFLPWALSFLPSSKEAISFFLIPLSLDVASSRKSPWTFFFLPELVFSGPSTLYSVAAHVTPHHTIHVCVCLLCWTLSTLMTRTGTSYMPSYFWYPGHQ